MDNVLVRRALSLALDRETLTRTVLQDASHPVFSITPPDTLGYNPPTSLIMTLRKRVSCLLKQAIQTVKGGQGLEIIYNTQEAHRKIAVAVQQMWKSELNIDVTIANQKWKVYLDSVSQRNFQVARRWIGDYVDAKLTSSTSSLPREETTTLATPTTSTTTHSQPSAQG